MRTHAVRIGTGLPKHPIAITTALAVAHRAAKEINDEETFKDQEYIFWFAANSELLTQLQTFHETHPQRQRIEANYGLRIVQTENRVLVIPTDKQSKLATFVQKVADRHQIAA